MKFEDALKLMREGKKIRINFMPEDEYYQVCFILSPLELGFESTKNKYISIVWMKGDKQHPDMQPYWNHLDPKTDPCRHGMFPMMNLLWIMSVDWIVLDA